MQSLRRVAGCWQAYPVTEVQRLLSRQNIWPASTQEWQFRFLVLEVEFWAKEPTKRRARTQPDRILRLKIYSVLIKLDLIIEAVF